jgi:hypothetical protein
VLGGLAALGIWAVGESFGQIYSGQATDPNSGPLLVLLAASVYSTASSLGTSSPWGVHMRFGSNSQRRLWTIRQPSAARTFLTHCDSP